MANQVDLITQNAQMRGALLALSPRMRKNLGNFTGGVTGGTTRVKLYNVGIITEVRTRTLSAFDIGTTIATPSPQAPFNIVNKFRLTDFDGTDRVNVPGYTLWLMNSVRNRTLWGYHNFAGGNATFGDPVVPTAIAANQTFSAWNTIPLAYDKEADLRGAILAQTALGEMYLNVDWNTVLTAPANADAVYNTATGTVIVNAGNSLQLQVWQDFLLPQAVGGQVPLPQIDLLTVYELNSFRSTDNIQANTEKLINYPNVRQVFGSYLFYVNNGVMTAVTTAAGGVVTNDMAQFRLIANGNNVLYDATMLNQLFEQRQYMYADGDLRASSYFFDHRKKPIETSVYGNVQLGCTPSAVTAGNTYFGVGFESMYTKGSVLPGLSQASG